MTQTEIAPPASRAWSLTLTDEPDALMRVLSMLRRRRCQVLSASFEGDDRHRPGTRLHLRVRSGGGRPAQIETWLAGLPDVLAVEATR